MSKNIEWKKSTIDYDKLNQLTVQKLAAAEWASNNLTGYKHSEKSKDNFRKAKIGTKRDVQSVKKSIEGTKQTRWQQTLNRLSKEDIINAQNKHGNHQSNTMNELGISFVPYKKLCKHYGIELKKSPKEKTEFARMEQSEPIKVYLYDKTKKNGRGEFLNEYYSIAEASRQLNIEKCRGHIISVLKKKRPHTNGYYFEYKNK